VKRKKRKQKEASLYLVLNDLFKGIIRYTDIKYKFIFLKADK